MFFRQLLAVTCASLLVVPVWGNGIGAGNIIGTVANSQFASVRGVTLAEGTTIYDGDVVSTEAQGDAWLALPNGAGILLGQNTQVQIGKDSAGSVHFDLAQGNVKFRSTEKTQVEGWLYDATIRAANGASVAGYVTLLPGNSAIISSERGDIVVTTEHDGGSRLIPAGSAIEVRMVPSQDDNNRTAKRRRGFIILLGAALIGGVVIAAIILNHHERQNVSPSSFPKP